MVSSGIQRLSLVAGTVLFATIYGSSAAHGADDGFFVSGEIANDSSQLERLTSLEGVEVIVKSAQELSSFEAGRFLPQGFVEPNCSFADVVVPVEADGSFMAEISKVEVIRGSGREFCEFIIEIELSKGDLFFPNRPRQLFGGSIGAGTVFPISVKAIKIGEVQSPARQNQATSDLAPILGGTLGIVILIGAVALGVWLAVLVARAAVRKGRSFWPWFWIAFFLLIPAAIIVAIMKNEPQQKVLIATAQPLPLSGLNGEPTKNCPYCGEEILVVAKKCKHCGEFFNS